MKFLERFWGGCGHCHGAESCPLVQAHEHSGPFSYGSTMVLAAISVFLLPILTVIVGACLAERYFAGSSFASVSCWQGIGGLVGFFVGVLVAKVIIACLRQTDRSSGGVE